jgi:hypothetical protein
MGLKRTNCRLKRRRLLSLPAGGNSPIIFFVIVPAIVKAANLILYFINIRFGWPAPQPSKTKPLSSIGNFILLSIFTSFALSLIYGAIGGLPLPELLKVESFSEQIAIESEIIKKSTLQYYQYLLS